MTKSRIIRNAPHLMAYFTKNNKRLLCCHKVRITADYTDEFNLVSIDATYTGISINAKTIIPFLEREFASLYTDSKYEHAIATFPKRLNDWLRRRNSDAFGGGNQIVRQNRKLYPGTLLRSQ